MRLETEPDCANAVEMQTSPSTEEVVYRSGQPTTEATVCLSADMAGMPAMGVSDVAHEVEPGVYEVSGHFEMAGRWDGSVLVTHGFGDRWPSPFVQGGGVSAGAVTATGSPPPPGCPWSSFIRCEEHLLTPTQ